MTDVIEVSTGGIEIVEVGLGGGVTSYNDLTDLPTLGTAATTASTDYATAAQGGLADSAMQPGDDAADLGSGAATDNYVLTADGIGGAAWEAAAITYAGAASEIHAATSKTTPIDADELGLADSAASYVLKKLTWANLKTTLSSFFAVLAGKSGGQTLIGGTGVTDELVLQGTSGVGTSTAAALQVNVGNNGATNALTVLNNGKAGLGDYIGNYKFSIFSDTTYNNYIRLLEFATSRSDKWGFSVGNGAYTDYFSFDVNENTNIFRIEPGYKIVSFSGGISSPAYRSSVAGRGDSEIIKWTNTGGSYNGKLELYTNYPYGDVSINQWIVNNGVWRVGKASLSAAVYPLVIPGNTGNVGVNTSLPVAKLHVTHTAEQLRLGYDATYYASFTVNSSGALTQTAIAGQTFIGGTGVTSKVTVQGTSGNGTSTAAAFEVKVGNNGNITAMYIRNDGNIYLPGPIENTTSGEGIVLKSPDGTRYKLTVANGGTLSISAA